MMRRGQQGVALITILLVVVIATILGVSMTNEQHFAVNQARTFFDQGAVRQYAYSGEELARQMLHEDFIESPEVDHYGENWGARDMKFEFEDGAVEIQIEDLQGRLNVNTLLATGNDSGLIRTRFNDYFTAMGVDTAFVERLKDWIDEDDGASGLGAEEFQYLGLDRPYRTGNQALMDISEMRLLYEMDPNDYAALEPGLTALPVIDTTINVNTATATVLQAVVPGLSLAEAEAIILQRDVAEPYTDVGTFASGLGAQSAQVNTTGLGVQSSFFKVSVRARYQDRFGYLTSIIQRNPTDGSMRVIYRDLSKKILPIVADETVSDS